MVRIVKTRPDRLLERMRYASGELADSRVDEWQLASGADVRIATTRGGSWPASQDMAIASPGWSWEDTQQGVLQKVAGEDDAALLRAKASLQVAGGEPAQEWVKQLLT